MAVNAELKVDPHDFSEELFQTATGWSGIRNYRVNTGRADLAMFALGLPKLGDKWGSGPADLSLLQVVKRGPTKYMGGRDDGTGAGGWTRVTIEYGTPDGFRIPITPSTRWTELNFSRGQFQTLKAIERFNLNADGTIGPLEPGDPELAVGNGDGAPVDYGIIEARVFTFQPLGRAFPLAAVTDMSRPAKLNQDAITLPQLYRFGPRLPMPAGGAKYLGIDNPLVNNNLLQIVHVLELAADFVYRWFSKDKYGHPIGPGWGDRVNPYRPGSDFMALWA